MKKKSEVYGYITWAVIYLKKTELNKETLGLNVLNELMDMHSNSPAPFICAWEYYFRQKKDYKEALAIAEKMFLLALTSSFEER